MFFGHEMIFVILYPAIDFKTSRIPTVKNCVSRSRMDDFIPHPASNFLCIPHPASILSPIPHPAKPMLDPLGGQTVKNLPRLACKFDLDQSERKSSQVNASVRKPWPNRAASRPKFSTCVYLGLRLARALDPWYTYQPMSEQGFIDVAVAITGTEL